MAALGERITRVNATTWFAIGALLTVGGYLGGENALWSLLWLIPHAVILLGVWRDSRGAWAIFVSVNVALATALAIAGIGTVFGSDFFLDIYWWGPAAHGAALLSFIAFRASRRRGVTLQHPNRVADVLP